MDRDNESWVTELRSTDSRQQAAFEDLRGALVRRLGRALAGRAAADDSFLDDVVQDTLVQILKRLDQFASRSAFLTWATSIAIHQAITELRRRRWSDVSLQDVIGADDWGPQRMICRDSPTDAEAERREILAALDDSIRQSLTDKQRQALVAELRGMPLEDIARCLGSNRNAVYKLTFDARKRLRQSLEAAGYRAIDIQAAIA
jgi:RNA polymerase sigma-70 factor (ECF subfamily)